MGEIKNLAHAVPFTNCSVLVLFLPFRSYFISFWFDFLHSKWKWVRLPELNKSKQKLYNFISIKYCLNPKNLVQASFKHKIYCLIPKISLKYCLITFNIWNLAHYHLKSTTCLKRDEKRKIIKVLFKLV